MVKLEQPFIVMQYLYGAFLFLKVGEKVVKGGLQEKNEKEDTRFFFFTLFFFRSAFWPKNQFVAKPGGLEFLTGIVKNGENICLPKTFAS